MLRQVRNWPTKNCDVRFSQVKFQFSYQLKIQQMLYLEHSFKLQVKNKPFNEIFIFIARS